jgi:hypothetical protein
MPNPKSAETEFEYLPIECPRCGAKGRLRIDRLDRSFTCKGCKRVYHVGVGGIMPGERPADMTDDIGALRASALREKPGLIDQLWAKVPKNARTLVGGGIFIGMLLLCNVVYFWFFSGPRVPEKLLDRAKYLGEAFARNDDGAFQRLVSSDSHEEAARLLEETRPEAWGVLPEDAVVTVRPPLKPDVASAKYGMATVTVKIIVSSTPGYLSIPLYWVPRSKSEAYPDWVLDAKRTFESTGKKRLTLTVPPPSVKQVRSEAIND